MSDRTWRYESCAYCAGAMVVDGLVTLGQLYEARDAHAASEDHKAGVWNTLPMSTRAEFVRRWRAGKSFTAPWLFVGGLPAWFPPEDLLRPATRERIAARPQRRYRSDYPRGGEDDR